jgi:hypothetical protein
LQSSVLRHLFLHCGGAREEEARLANGFHGPVRPGMSTQILKQAQRKTVNRVHVEGLAHEEGAKD